MSVQVQSIHQHETSIPMVDEFPAIRQSSSPHFWSKPSDVEVRLPQCLTESQHVANLQARREHEGKQAARY